MRSRDVGDSSSQSCELIRGVRDMGSRDKGSEDSAGSHQYGVTPSFG